MTAIDSSVKGPAPDADSRCVQGLRKLISAERCGALDPNGFEDRCGIVLKELARHGIRFVSMALRFDCHGVVEILVAEHRAFDCGPFVEFPDPTGKVFERLADDLASLAARGLRLELEPMGLEVSDLSCVLRVCLATGVMEVDELAVSSPLPELADSGYGVRLRG